jgi:BolA protein
MTLVEQIEHKLREAFSPDELVLTDDSHKHRNHPGAQGRAHLSLRIVSDAFAGQSSLARHRAVYRVLADELAGPLHALIIDARTKAEA